jgi:5-formyltetrahydrofolate cyclo-ligase
MDDEVDTRNLILKWADKKRFILPAINGDELDLKEFTGSGDLVSGDLYSIPEPAGKPFSSFDIIDLAVVPGVAFDRQNNRMGRGKAYYDKILLKLKGRAKMIGVCYDFQIVDEVPAEPHDIKMDEVIHD